MSDAEKATTIFIYITAEECKISFENKNKIVVFSKSGFGTNAMDAVVKEYFAKKLNLMIGDRAAHAVRTEIGNDEPEFPQAMDVRGRDLNDKELRRITVTTNNVNEALAEIFEAIINNVRDVISQQSNELTFSKTKNNIILQKDGKGFGKLAQQLAIVTKLPITIAKIPTKKSLRWLNPFIKWN